MVTGPTRLRGPAVCLPRLSRGGHNWLWHRWQRPKSAQTPLSRPPERAVRPVRGCRPPLMRRVRTAGRARRSREFCSHAALDGDDPPGGVEMQDNIGMHLLALDRCGGVEADHQRVILQHDDPPHRPTARPLNAARACPQVMWEADRDWRDAARVGLGALRQPKHRSRDGLDAGDIWRSAPR